LASLEDVCEALKLRNRKDPRGAALIKQLCLPQKDGTFLEDPALLAELAEYNVTDVDALRELDRKLPPLDPQERWIFEYDMTLNDRGVGVDLELLHAGQELAVTELAKVNAELSTATNGTITRVTQRNRILAAVNVYGANAVDLRKGSVQRLLENAGLSPEARKLLELRRDGAKASLAKYKAISERQVEGRLCGSLLFYGGHTGRHSSTGAQLQNLTRPEHEDWVVTAAIEDILEGRTEALSLLYGPPIALLSDAVRGLLVPAAGHLFEVADLSAIELRVAAWLAGEQWVLDALEKGEDVYCQTASAVYERKIVATNEKERHLGKTLELAAMYGLGGAGFVAACAKQGLVIVESFGRHAIQTYRATHPRVVGYWRLLGNAAWAAVRKPGEIHRAGKVSFQIRGAWLLVRLPSGRFLRYYRSEIFKGELCYWGVDQRTRKFTRISTWGGKLLENVTQAISRDILMHGCALAEASGRNIVLLVHDEAVAEVEAGKADSDGLCALLSPAPAWAADLPLLAKGAVLNRYKKL
jgi:DNA polymerase